jgi:hypothetical protein
VTPVGRELGGFVRFHHFHRGAGECLCGSRDYRLLDRVTTVTAGTSFPEPQCTDQTPADERDRTAERAPSTPPSSDCSDSGDADSSGRNEGDDAEDGDGSTLVRWIQLLRLLVELVGLLVRLTTL